MIKMCTAIYNERFRGCKVERDELISEGVYAMCKYSSRYDKGYGVSESTYLYNCACKRMLYYYNKQRKYVDLIHLDEYDYDFVGAEDEKMGNYNNDLERLKAVSIGGKSGKRIIQMIMGDMQICDIAKELGVSRQYVSKVFTKWKNKVNEKYDFINGELVLKKW